MVKNIGEETLHDIVFSKVRVLPPSGDDQIEMAIAIVISECCAVDDVVGDCLAILSSDYRFGRLRDRSRRDSAHAAIALVPA